MDGTPVRFPTRSLIFNDIRFVGFWLDRWKKKKTTNEIRNALEDVLQPLALTKIKYPIDSVYELKDFRNALARNSESRFGKVLMVRQGSELLNLKDQDDE
jgi:NADPH:quinone reductase-like Zn-dependent oxidoreductase